MRLVSLVESHDRASCPGCPVCTEIRDLRKQLLKSGLPANKFKHILSKGQDMKKSEIQFLLENGVKKMDIQKALDLSGTKFNRLITDLGLVTKTRKRKVKDMGKLSLEEYQDLKAGGKSDKEIAADKGMNPQYLSQLKKKWGLTKDTVRPVNEQEDIPKNLVEVKKKEHHNLLNEEISTLKQMLIYTERQLNASTDRVQELEAKLKQSEHINQVNENVLDKITVLSEENAALWVLLKARI
jgi:BMFP domain-containing protein YqiC